VLGGGTALFVYEGAKGKAMIQKTPIYIELDRRREVIFNLNTEILIKGTAAAGKTVLETIGKRHNEETGEDEPVLSVNAENLRVYLWAGLQDDARRRGEMLTQEEVGRFLTCKRQITEAVAAVLMGINQYYGDEQPGEAIAPAAK
jgi:hypothetical protein